MEASTSGVDGKEGKSSSSRPGGFGCSGVKLFLKESEGFDLYGLLASDAGSVETCSGDDSSLMVTTGGGVKTSTDDDDDDEEEEEAGGAGPVDVAAVTAATAANSSSAFRIRSRSLKVLKVLLLSLETSGDTF